MDAAGAAYGAASRTRSSSRRRRPLPSSLGSAAAAQRPSQRSVKSSGYGIAASGSQRKLFEPVVNQPREPRRGIRGSPGWAATPPALEPWSAVGGAGGGLLARTNDELMRTWTPPLRQSARVSLWHDFGTVVRLAASGGYITGTYATARGPTQGKFGLSSHRICHSRRREPGLFVRPGRAERAALVAARRRRRRAHRGPRRSSNVGLLQRRLGVAGTRSPHRSIRASRPPLLF